MNRWEFLSLSTTAKHAEVKPSFRRANSFAESDFHQTRSNSIDSKCRIPRPVGKRLIQRSQSLNLTGDEKLSAEVFAKMTSSNTTRHSYYEPQSPIKKKFASLRQLYSEDGLTSLRPEIFETESLKTFSGSNSSLVSLETCLTNYNGIDRCAKRNRNVLHCQHIHEEEEYLTPTQRYVREIRRLKVLLRKSNLEVAIKSKEIEQLRKEVSEYRQVASDGELPSNYDSTENQMAYTTSSSKTSDSGNCEQWPEVNSNHQVQSERGQSFEKINSISPISSQCESEVTNSDLQVELDRAKLQICDLEIKIMHLEEEYIEKEKKHQQTYLEMYKKGQEAARFQHADEVLEFAHQAPNRVHVPELLQQLRLTEHELDKMKKIYRLDVYHKKGELTDAEITLRFLKDAIYYFLTEKDSICHLRVIENIVCFSEVERRNIQRSMSTRKNNTKPF